MESAADADERTEEEGGEAIVSHQPFEPTHVVLYDGPATPVKIHAVGHGAYLYTEREWAGRRHDAGAQWTVNLTTGKLSLNGHKMPRAKLVPMEHA